MIISARAAGWVDSSIKEEVVRGSGDISTRRPIAPVLASSPEYAGGTS